MTAPQPIWSERQRAALEVLEVVPWRWRSRAPIEQPATAVAAQAPAQPAAVSAEPVDGWSLLASADQRAEISAQRWFRQLALYVDELATEQAPGRAAVILLGQRRLPLEGQPPKPSPGVKRELYLALRNARARR